MLGRKSVSISKQLTAVEAMVARAAWGEVRDTLGADPDATASNLELLAWYGEALLRCGATREAFAWLEPRVALASPTANRRAWMRAVNLAGAAAFEIGRIDDAERYFSQSRDLADADEDHLLCARSLNNLALVASTRGDVDAAMGYYALAVPAYQRAGFMRGLAESYHNMAVTLMEAGELERAEEAERLAIEYAQGTTNERLHTFIVAGRAEVVLRKGDHALAIALGRVAAEGFHQIGDRSSEALALRLVGLALLGQNHLDEAAATLTTAADLAARSGVIRAEAECRFARARCFKAQHRDDLALPDLERARVLFEALRAPEKRRAVEESIRAIRPS